MKGISAASIFGVVFATSVLVGCGGGGESEPTAEAKTVTARVARFPTPVMGINVTLDATTSSSTADRALTFKWDFSRKPSWSELVRPTANGAVAEFVPDRTGLYNVRVEVSDGVSTDVIVVGVLVQANSIPDIHVDTTRFSALDESLHILDASQSFDREGHLDFQWEVTEMPLGAVVEPATGSGEVFSFASSVVGTYEVTLNTDDGVTKKTRVFRAGRYHTDAEFEISISDAVYHQDSGVALAIDAGRAEAHVIDVVNSTQTSVPLPAPPLSVAMAPAGDFAVFGHENLVTELTIEPGYPLVSHSVSFKAQHVAHDGSGRVYATDGGYILRSIEIATGTLTEFPNVYVDAMRIHPIEPWIYVSWSFGIHKLDISGGTVTKLYEKRDGGCGRNHWLSRDGMRIFESCGKVLRSTSTEATDMTELGQLERIEGEHFAEQFRSIGESPNQLVAAALGMATLRWYGIETLETLETDVLPYGPEGEALIPIIAGWTPGADETFVLAVPADGIGKARLLRR